MEINVIYDGIGISQKLYNLPASTNTMALQKVILLLRGACGSRTNSLRIA